MAMKKMTTAGKGAGNAVMAPPPGFSTTKNRFYADGVARRFDSLPPAGLNGGGAVRVLLVANKGTGHEQVQGLLGNPRIQLRTMAPGVYTALLTPKDMETSVAPEVGSDKTFRWVDLAHRLFGASARNADDMVTVAVAAEGSMADAKKKLKSLGMTFTGTTPEEMSEEDVEWEGGPADADEGLLVGTLPASKLYDLALWTKAASIEIRSVEAAGRG